MDQARKGQRRQATRDDDSQVLGAARAADAKGVCFPLSATHYEETARITSPEKRKALKSVMAPISQMQTFWQHRSSLRHQFLEALHQTTRRPTFRPREPKVICIGLHRAFAGEQAFFKVVDQKGRVSNSVDGSWARHLNQYGEAALLAGPLPNGLPSLIEQGYVMP